MSIEKIERWLRDQIEFPNGEVTLSEAEARALLDELSRLRQNLAMAEASAELRLSRLIEANNELEEFRARALSEREGQE